MMPADESSAVGRNSPCPCGSGRRFKDCCGAVPAQAAASALEATYRPAGNDWSGIPADQQQALSAMMEDALSRQRDGALVEAAALYRQVLYEAPLTHDALHMLGVVTFGSGDLDSAQYLLREASMLRPDYPGLRNNIELVAAAIRRRSSEPSGAAASASGRSAAPIGAAEPAASWRAAPARVTASPDPRAPIHIVGIGTGSVDDNDGGWFVARMNEVLRPRAPATFWAADLREGVRATALGVPMRHLADPAGAFASGGVLVVVGSAVDLARSVDRSNPSRVVLFVERCTPGRDHAKTVSRLAAATGVSVELIFQSASHRLAFDAPGRICVPPIDLPPDTPAQRQHPPRSAPHPFVVGAVAVREESIRPPSASALWRDLAADGAQVMLRGANRLRQALGADRAIQIRSRQLEPLPSFLGQLDCLVHDVNDQADEGWGVDLFIAMALGVPVLCSKRSWHADNIVHGGNGFVFDDERELRQIVRDLHADAAMAARVGAAGRSWAHTAFAPDALRAQYGFLTGD